MSARPGRILARRSIELARPRDLEITYSDGFIKLVHDLRERIGKVRKPAEPAQ
jgi:NitT/TauT family transport system ATP-binding protein